MINNPVYVKKGGAAVDTLDLHCDGDQPAKGGSPVIRYEGKALLVEDLPVAYHGGEVTLLHSFKNIKIEGNVLSLGY